MLLVSKSVASKHPVILKKIYAKQKITSWHAVCEVFLNRVLQRRGVAQHLRFREVTHLLEEMIRDVTSS
jgi:hypothetical protein